MNDARRGLVAGSLLGDAISLGVHWIYDTDQIQALFGDFSGFTDPVNNLYHKTKKLGDFTHYGDQMIILLDFIKKHGSYDLAGYLASWTETMKSYTGYMDYATKVTLERGQGSDSFDGSAIGRIAPLFFSENAPEDAQIAEFIGFTHDHDTVKAGALFFTHVIRTIWEGKTPTEALKKTSSNSLEIMRFLDEGLESINQDTNTVIKKLGQSCGIDGVFQGAIHCIVKYEQDFKMALLANAKAGGDSAARGMIIGMILGAYLGYEKLPQDWLATMNTKV